ncbi:hypothetical protein S100390_v1c05460 [Spiroplasma sp. NBRC 100390]|uniref:HNH endonuclease n=1 Tax=unclassified Spiroplasma TaxID=2637901 RepID=UPI0008928EBB|nr:MULTISPECIES: HNH endonuclease [unclassified Spiroplasma]AOX43885.1 hypothetical protein STU14_v1c05460 [Spiroplasma sp. TU-14]APE13355.1 hypothetical protein S100390_v1c05460 [Spiroplasma sp. NBRC 100390]
MKENNHKWGRYERNSIWKSYAMNKVQKYFEHKDYSKYDLFQEAPCKYCGQLMLKAQYQDIQPNKDYSWVVDYIDTNFTNNTLENLQPAHPWCCNKK